jgi:hypothetical protein
MPFDNIRVPPDSTGKRIITHKTLELTYNSGTIDFELNDDVVGLSSGALGTVSRVTGTTSSGTIFLVMSDESADFLSSEALQVIGVTNAFAIDAGTEGHIQKVVSVGGNNPYNEQRINNNGCSYTRFLEGDPQFSAFGELRISQSMAISKYHHVYSDLEGSRSEDIYTETTGTASATRNVDSSDVTLQVDTASGDKVTRTTNRYHIYTPGSAQLVEMSLVVGDTGKTNVVRRWGAFDDDDGLFFQLNENTFQVVIRSNTSGTPAETTVDQDDFNRDKVDGSLDSNNLSGMNFDLSKSNIYWIDYQWLGSGKVRFGLYSKEGDRITLHTFENSNSNSLAFMSTGTLPLRWEMENTGVTGSVSEMRCICSTVQAEGFDPNEISIKRDTISENVLAFTASSTEIPMISFRPAATYGSKTNRNPILLKDMTAFTDQPAILKIRLNSTLGGGTSWSAAGNFTETDVSSTTTSGGQILYSHLIISGGLAELNLREYFNYLHEYLCLRSDGTQSNTYTVTAQRLTASDASVSIAANWIEVLG